MQDLNLEYKLEESLRCCPTKDCGKILEGRQIYCKECNIERKKKLCKKWRDNRKDDKKEEAHPTWRCDKCGEIITFKFDILKLHNKFEKIISEHICQTE